MEKHLRILVLEDMEDDHDLIEYILTEANLNFTTKRVDSREQFVSALKKDHVDVILSDHSLPQFNSDEALGIYRESGLKIPFILVTGAVSDEFAVNSLKQGADDYVLKSNLTRLPAAIVNAVKQREAEAEKVLANEAMRKQYEELMKINKELDSFVYSVSHNLRAPLRSVLGLINVARMEDEKRGTTTNEYFTMIESSMHKLDDTLKEILDYSRNSRQELSVELIDFQSLLDDNLEKMQFMPGSSSINKEININEYSPFYSDKYRISVIFNNLISNAIKYYDPHKECPSLRIAIDISEERAHMVFQDNGIGIDKQYLNKVFNMFFRATQSSEGAGLGLYIVQEAVEKLKGTVVIESELRKGTTFIIDIPNTMPNK
ncbi:MAG TPA: hybrid sensor histidine kinase/response regulator [Chryseolinea sp.]|nr:hybrid sensor histidine kinase/response regulator [Chryseolinea sp.]